MYVIVAGIGQVGLQIVETLLQDGHNLAVIESDQDRMAAIESLDLLSVLGNAASNSSLVEAGVNSADLVIAATGSDEVNIICSVIAKAKGCRTIARINSKDYMPDDMTSGKLDMFGIDLAICPDHVTATRMAKMLLLPSLVESEDVTKDGAKIISFSLTPECSAISRLPESVELPNNCVITAVSRFGAVSRPDLAGELREGDKVFIIINSQDNIPLVEGAFGLAPGISQFVGERLETGLEKIMIIGATDIGKELSRLLESSRQVVLIDEDEDRCKEAAVYLKNGLVINSCGTDDAVLREEGIEDVGAFVATTERSEYNMLSCLLAKSLGVRKTMAVVEDPDLRPLFEQIGINVPVSPRMITANAMLRHIKRGSTTLSAIPGPDSRVIEVTVTKSLWIAGKEFGKIKLPSNSFIGAVVRNKGVMTPTQFDIVRPGDKLILFVGVDSLKRVEKMFTRSHKYH